MSSQRKLESARANGALGRGRKTPAGLERSAQNAYRHGLFAEVVLLPGEHAANFAELHRQFRDRFLPVDGVEDGLIEEMVCCWWRLRRGWSMEKNLMASNMEDQLAPDRSTRTANAFSYLAVSPPINLLHRYESRLQRNFQRAMDNLMRLREDDRREEAWTAQNAPLQEVRLPRDPDPEEPSDPPLPPPLPSGNSANKLNKKDLQEESALLKPVPANRPDQREQKLRNEANPISGHPAETAQTSKTQDVPHRKGPKASRHGRF